MGLTGQTFQALMQRFPQLPGPAQYDAKKVLEKQDQIRNRFRMIADRRNACMRIRLHDDLHLGQVLHTGKDFVFIGFEGRADRPLSDRRIKRCPLRDLASMLLSFEYAAHAVFMGQVPGITVRSEIVPALEFWRQYWFDWVSASFLAGYFNG